MPSLCVFGKPCIRSLCDPVDRIASYVHYGIKIGYDEVKQPLLKARFSASCVAITGGRIKSFEFRLIIKNLVHFVGAVAFVAKDNAGAFVRFSDNIILS